MRNINRIDNYIDTIKEIWKKYPDLRFTQLFLNCFNSTFDYYMEDDESLKRISNFYEVHKGGVSYDN